jgi:four helix bundle protein
MLTKREFAAKMAIASKEARESDYWLRLLSDSGYLSGEHAASLRGRCLELIRILTAIVKTSTTKH